MPNPNDAAEDQPPLVPWVIGDIHGCFAELLELEAKITATARRLDHRPLFVSVGDLVDRGPRSREVVEHFLRGSIAGTHRAVAGNHEGLMLRCLWVARRDLFEDLDLVLPPWVESVEDTLDRLPSRARMAPVEVWADYSRLMWVMQGGAETLESYGFDPALPESWEIPDEHLRYLCELPVLWEADNVSVTHALVNRQDLQDLRGTEPPERVSMMRAIWSRVLPDSPPDPERTHVSGHTVLGRVQRVKHLNVVRIDLGAYGGHRLAGWCPTHDRTISVASSVQWPSGS